MEKKSDDEGLMLINLLAGTVFGLIAGVVVGVSLTQNTEPVLSFLGARWWEVLTAIGGMAAAVGAFYTARIALRISVDGECRQRESEKASALAYLVGKRKLIYRAYMSLDTLQQALTTPKKCEDGYLGVDQELLTQLQDISAELDDFEYYKARLIDRDLMHLADRAFRNLDYILESFSEKISFQDKNLRYLPSKVEVITENFFTINERILNLAMEDASSG